MKRNGIDGKKSFLLRFNWKLKKVYEKMFYYLTVELHLTQNEIDVLLFLYNNNSLNTASDIARYRAMSKSMISKSVDSLYRKGYLSYEADKTDRRCIYLIIQPAATPIMKKLYAVQQEFFAVLSCNITEKENEVMETVLNKMYQNIVDQYETYEDNRRDGK